MAVRYYDDAIADKLNKWIPDNSQLKVLKPDETSRLFSIKAEETGDKPLKLPLIALSRSKDIELNINIKNNRSFDGLTLSKDKNKSLHFNVIPIKLAYQMDIYTKKYFEGDEYVRNFLFKLINNPKIIIEIPYNGMMIKHVAYIRILSTVSDTSDITEHLFADQFTRWTIQFEVQDAFLFSIPYRNNWKFGGIETTVGPDLNDITADTAWQYIYEPCPCSKEEIKNPTPDSGQITNLNEFTPVETTSGDNLNNSISVKTLKATI